MKSERYTLSNETLNSQKTSTSIEGQYQKLEQDRESYLEILTYIDKFLICRSKKMHGGSCFNTYGYICLRQLEPSYHWTKYLEGIVHETAHHSLFAIWFAQPILEKEAAAEYYYSPLRNELRPINGVFHAMYVLARVVRIFNILKKHKEYLEDLEKVKYNFNNAKNNTSFEKKFDDAYEIVKNNAKLTPFGKKFLSEIKQLTR